MRVNICEKCPHTGVCEGYCGGIMCLEYWVKCDLFKVYDKRSKIKWEVEVLEEEE